MHHLGVELHAVEAASLVGDHGVGRTGRRGDDVEALGDGDDLVAMAHPDRLFLADRGQVGQQGRGFLDGDLGAAELAGVAALDLAAQLFTQGHLAVADAQHRHAGLEHGLGRAGAAFLVHALGTARQDDGGGVHPRQSGLGLLERMDFAIDAGLAQAARDQLRHLAAEVDDEDLLVVVRRGHGVIESGAGGCAGSWPCKAGISSLGMFRAARPSASSTAIRRSRAAARFSST